MIKFLELVEYREQQFIHPSLFEYKELIYKLRFHDINLSTQIYREYGTIMGPLYLYDPAHSKWQNYITYYKQEGI